MPSPAKWKRFLGETVWDCVQPSFGPLAYKVLGIRRGTVTRCYRDRYGRKVIDIEWAGDIDHMSGTVLSVETMKPGLERNCMFNWAVHNARELAILVKGGLLDGSEGSFHEIQSEQLVALHPLFELALKYPERPVILNPKINGPET